MGCDNDDVMTLIALLQITLTRRDLPFDDTKPQGLTLDKIKPTLRQGITSPMTTQDKISLLLLLAMYMLSNWSRFDYSLS